MRKYSGEPSILISNSNSISNTPIKSMTKHPQQSRYNLASPFKSIGDTYEINHHMVDMHAYLISPFLSKHT